MDERNAVYSVNQKIVYPSQGVGEIREIAEKEFRGEMVLYYVVYFSVSDMTIMVPVDKAEEIGVRAIVAPEDAEKALRLLGENFDPAPSDWKVRYQMNLDLLKKGSVFDIATIVRSLFYRSKVKELPIQERKLYESARKLLEDEIVCSLNIERAEADALIREKLEPPSAQNAAPSRREFEDDDFIDGEGDPPDDDDTADEAFDGDDGDFGD